MKTFFLSLLLTLSIVGFAQTDENWTTQQLMPPAELAQAINAKQDLPLIISVGPGADIPGTLALGMASKKENLEKLTKQLAHVSRDKKIVVYCGCCPFEHCPNVRPAIEALKASKFSNYYLLNLSHNIKTDWIDKGYPIAKP